MKILLPLMLLLVPVVAPAQTYLLEHGSPGRVERGQTIHRTPTGELYVGGSVGDSALVQRIGANGEVLWSRAFKPSTTYPCLVMHLNSTPDGFLIGCGNGMSTGSVALRDGFHFKIDPLGNVLWVRGWVDTRPVYSKRIVPMSANSYLLFADVYDLGSSTFADVFTAQIDAATGDVTAHSDLYDLYAPVPYIDDIASTAELSGAHYATGRIFTNGASVSTCRVYVSRYDSLGALAWTRYLFYPNSADRRMYGSDIIAHDDSLTIAFFGNITGSSGVYRVGVARLDTAGNVAWGRVYDFATQTSEYASSIVATANGYLVSGYGFDTGPKDFFLLEVSREGTLLWARSYGNNIVEEGLAYHYAPNMLIDGNELMMVGRRKYTNDENELLIRLAPDGTIGCAATPLSPFNTTVLPTTSYPSTWSTSPLTIALGSTQPSAGSSITEACAAVTVDLGPDTTSCDPLLLDAGNPGASYLWSDGSTGQTLQADTGTYWVQVTVDCCTRTDTIHIGGGDPPVAGFTWTQDPPGSTTVALTDTSANANWNTWLLGSSIASADSLAYDFGEYGHYVVGLIVGNDCGTDTVWQQVDVFPAMGVPQVMGHRLTCIPEAGGILVMLPGQGTWHLDVYNGNGLLVQRHTGSNGRAHVPMADHAAGIYFLVASNGQGIAVGRTYHRP
ncbi:MAG: hypothetical protein JNL05_11335 [Flavobacteriales bacterium]|nr:hypothetical protein [Flavobacteriales bacterium]